VYKFICVLSKGGRFGLYETFTAIKGDGTPFKRKPRSRDYVFIKANNTMWPGVRSVSDASGEWELFWAGEYYRFTLVKVHEPN
jgi:hypothetical protein